MFVANSHLKLMQSFVTAPQMHIAALKNPAMRGGPFINYDANKVPEIRKLLEKTVKEQTLVLNFAAAVQSLTQGAFRPERFGLRAFRSPHHTASAAALLPSAWTTVL